MKAKYILPISDIHLNFYNGEFPLFKDDRNKETILCIAGDLWASNKLVTHVDWLCSLADSFHSVVFVLGNHDYWGLSLEEANRQCTEGLQQLGLENVHLLNASSVNIEGTTFVGATLWTDFCQENPEIMSVAPMYMVDYGKIRKDRKANRITAKDILKEHKKQRKVIFKLAKEAEGDVVIITHHAPSALSIHDKYKDEGITNCFYYSSLENEILKCGNLKLWLHGHMHDSADYNLPTKLKGSSSRVGAHCRLVCNPMGYTRNGMLENKSFNSEMYISIFEF